MADKTTGELPAVKVGDLPLAPDVYDDSLIPVELQGSAMHITGAQWKAYAKAAVRTEVTEAQAAKNAAAQSAVAAEKSNQNAQGQAYQAAQSAVQAETSRRAIEDMEVHANTLQAGSAASVTKSVQDGVVHLTYGIPQGTQGAVGPQGAQGVEGPPGPQGINGVAVTANGQYAFNVDERGHLILSYTGDTAPDFRINENGHLILTL